MQINHLKVSTLPDGGNPDQVQASDWNADHTYTFDPADLEDLGAEPEIAAGSTSQYWRGDKSWQSFADTVRASVLTGLSTASSAVIAATDTVIQAFGKLQAQITALLARVTATEAGLAAEVASRKALAQTLLGLPDVASDLSTVVGPSLTLDFISATDTYSAWETFALEDLTEGLLYDILNP